MIICNLDITREDGSIIVVSKSDSGFMIRQKETGVLYETAGDVGVLENGIYKPKYFSYEETNVKIEEKEVEENE